MVIIKRIGTPKIIIVIILKKEQIVYCKVVMYPKDTFGMENSVDSDQTAP